MLMTLPMQRAGPWGVQRNTVADGCVNWTRLLFASYTMLALEASGYVMAIGRSRAFRVLLSLSGPPLPIH